jgi:hypothetical protein
MKVKTCFAVFGSATIYISNLVYAQESMADNAGWLAAVESAASVDASQLNAERAAAMDRWRTCLDNFSKDAAEVQSDPTDLVVSISFIACSGEEGNARLAWAKEFFKSSRFRPTPADAIGMAENAVADLKQGHRDRLLVAVSYARQIEALRRKSSDLLSSVLPR